MLTQMINVLSVIGTMTVGYMFGSMLRCIVCRKPSRSGNAVTPLHVCVSNSLTVGQLQSILATADHNAAVVVCADEPIIGDDNSGASVYRASYAKEADEPGVFSIFANTSVAIHENSRHHEQEHVGGRV